jgi:hypothetical protein
MVECFSRSGRVLHDEFGILYTTVMRQKRQCMLRHDGVLGEYLPSLGDLYPGERGGLFHTGGNEDPTTSDDPRDGWNIYMYLLLLSISTSFLVFIRTCFHPADYFAVKTLTCSNRTAFTLPAFIFEDFYRETSINLLAMKFPKAAVTLALVLGTYTSWAAPAPIQDDKTPNIDPFDL